MWGETPGALNAPGVSPLSGWLALTDQVVQ
jgi:hypothetical protein